MLNYSVLHPNILSFFCTNFLFLFSKGPMLSSYLPDDGAHCLHGWVWHCCGFLCAADPKLRLWNHQHPVNFVCKMPGSHLALIITTSFFRLCVVFSLYCVMNRLTMGTTADGPKEQSFESRFPSHVRKIDLFLANKIHWTSCPQTLDTFIYSCFSSGNCNLAAALSEYKLHVFPELFWVT